MWDVFFLTVNRYFLVPVASSTSMTPVCLFHMSVLCICHSAPNGPILPSVLLNVRVCLFVLFCHCKDHTCLSLYVTASHICRCLRGKPTNTKIHCAWCDELLLKFQTPEGQKDSRRHKISSFPRSSKITREHSRSGRKRPNSLWSNLTEWQSTHFYAINGGK